MRQCFICTSESPACGHREPRVLMAERDAERWHTERANAAEVAWVAAYQQKLTEGLATGLETPRNGNGGKS